MGHAQHQPLGGLQARVASLHFVHPVRIREREVRLLVHQEIAARAFAAENVELSVDDLPRVGIAAPRNRVNHAVGAEAAELRNVLVGACHEQVAMLRAGETISDTIVVGLDGGIAGHMLAVGEVGDRVVALQHQVRVRAVRSGVEGLAGGKHEGRDAGKAKACCSGVAHFAIVLHSVEQRRQSVGDQVDDQRVGAHHRHFLQPRARRPLRLARAEEGRGDALRIDGGAARLGRGQLGDGLRDGIGIEHRHRRAAIAARGVARQVDRRAAAGTPHLRHALAEPGDFRPGEAAHEILLAQELHEARQPAVALRAAVIGDAVRALHVEGELERARAVRAGEPLGHRPHRAVALLVDQSEQLDHRAGRELGAFVLVEPDDLAIEAHVEAQLAEDGAAEAARVHRRGTTGAIHFAVPGSGTNSMGDNLTCPACPVHTAPMPMRLLAVLLAAFTAAPAFAEDVAAVRTIDLDRYAGTWREIASIPQFFQRKCASGTTAIYAKLANGLLGVDNSCLTKEGQRIAAEGRARVADAQSPAKLEVTFLRFLGEWRFWFGADYWVIGLDPGYRWAVVGHPARTYAWVLARGPRLTPPSLPT